MKEKCDSKAKNVADGSLVIKKKWYKNSKAATELRAVRMDGDAVNTGKAVGAYSLHIVGNDLPSVLEFKFGVVGRLVDILKDEGADDNPLEFTVMIPDGSHSIDFIFYTANCLKAFCLVLAELACLQEYTPKVIVISLGIGCKYEIQDIKDAFFGVILDLKYGSFGGGGPVPDSELLKLKNPVLLKTIFDSPGL